MGFPKPRREPAVERCRKCGHAIVGPDHLVGGKARKVCRRGYSVGEDHLYEHACDGTIVRWVPLPPKGRRNFPKRA